MNWWQALACFILRIPHLFRGGCSCGAEKLIQTEPVSANCHHREWRKTQNPITSHLGLPVGDSLYQGFSGESAQGPTRGFGHCPHLTAARLEFGNIRAIETNVSVLGVP